MLRTLFSKLWERGPHMAVHPPPTAAEEAAFARYADEFTHGLTTVATLLIGMVALAWWPLDSLVLPKTVGDIYVALRVSLLVFAASSFGLLQLIPPGRAATAVCVAGIIVFTAIVGRFMGAMEGLLGLQYMYPLPFAVTLLASRAPLRLVTAVLVVVVSWSAAAWSANGLPAVAMGTLSSSVGAALVAVLFSETLYRLMRSRHVSEQRLTALRAHLEERVQEQGRDLRALARMQIDARDGEVRWLSRELHDALGQELTAMRVVVDLATIQLDAGASATARATLDEVRSLLQRQQVSLRRVLARMRPEAVEQLGLVDALRSLAQEVTRGSRVVAEVSLDEHIEGVVTRLTPQVADTLYRILQEALSNVVRHAEATVASVTLEYEAHTVVLRVADDGIGPTAPRDGACHVGLVGIRERAALCGGTASWGPGPQQRGMQVDVRLPLGPPVADTPARAAGAAPGERAA